MHRLITNVAGLPRRSKFALRVGMLYFSLNQVIHYGRAVVMDGSFEVSLRLGSEAPVCDDIINGETLRLPFPHVAWKRPHIAWMPVSPLPRDTIAFVYPPEMVGKIEALGLMPDENARAVTMIPELEQLVTEFRNLQNSLYTPGVVDRMDWLCFRLLRVLQESDTECGTAAEPMECRIRNIASYLQMHCSEPLKMDRVARENNLSRNAFFREWRRVFACSPGEYVFESRLNVAADQLISTAHPVFRIARESGFSGLYTFYRMFKRKFGQTPREFRERRTP